MSTKLGKLLGPFCFSLGLALAVSAGGCSSSTSTPLVDGSADGVKHDGGDAAGGTAGHDASADTTTADTGVDTGADTATDAATDTATDASDAAGEGG